MIAPVFEQLAQSEAKPGKMSFAKVNVDNQQDVAQKYGVSAMPTFLILKNGSVNNTIRGANTSALRSAVMAASSDAVKGPAKQSAVFSSKGQVLGDSSSKPRSTSSNALSFSLPSGFFDDAVRFVALYMTTLLSFDASNAARASPFSRAS